jgi:HTH-type transcriptional regulator / antitoxin HigA
MKANDFSPHWISPPGDTIRDVMQKRHLLASDLAEQLNLSPAAADGLMDGRTALTPEIAERLQSSLGGSSSFWLAREAQYRRDVLRLSGAGKTG